MKPALLLLAALPLFAAIDGTVTNKTTAKPQAGATVTIYKLGESGMESMETVKSDAQGKFSLEYKIPPGPHLIQTAFDGVTYNKMLPPGSPTTGIQLDVFNSQAKQGDAKVTQHMLLLEPNDGKLTINENIIYQNAGTHTYNDPAAGTLRFFLPTEAQGKVKVMAAAPNGMPIERAAKATQTPNIFAIDFPIKPGETRFQLTYELPIPDPAVYSAKILHKEGTTRLVTPKGVSLKGEAIQELGREPATQAAIYSVKEQDFKIEIEGTGTLRSSGSAEESGGGGGDGPNIQEILPRVYDRLYFVLGLAAVILVLGFVMVYRASSSSTPLAEAAAGKGKRKA